VTTRRDFIKSLASAATMAGIAGAPKFSFAQESGKTFIKVFMRGGADGLHLFPLVGDTMNAYRDYRPNLYIPPASGAEGGRAINLGSDMRQMNPNLQALQEIWDSGNMMIAPATSFAGANRSHFDCQRWIGTGARNNLIDGYLNRYMQEEDTYTHPLRGIVAGKTSLSTEIRGEIKVPTIQDAGGYEIEDRHFCEGNGCADNRLTEMMRSISSHDVDLSAAEGNIKDNQAVMLESIADVARAAELYTPASDLISYSNSSLGRGLRLCAQLIKAGIPLEVAALDWNIGWDTHSNQIQLNGNQPSSEPFTDPDKRYHSSMALGASDFLSFWRDMGADMNNIVVLVGSEFGRTKKENGNFGTDHGEGGAWFAFGGPTVGGFGPDVETIHDSVVSRNWVPTMASYRDIVGEIMVKHMGMDETPVSTIFPGHDFTDHSLFGGMA